MSKLQEILACGKQFPLLDSVCRPGDLCRECADKYDAISKLILEDVIGEDEPVGKHSWHEKSCPWHEYLIDSDCNCGLTFRNALRASQRGAVAKLEDE